MAQIEINPTEITLEFVSGGSAPSPEPVAVTNSGGGTLNQAQVIGGTPGFISIGVSPGGANNNQTLTFSVNNTNQPVGLTVYVATVWAIGSISPRFLTINVNVQSPPSIEVEPTVLNYGVATPGASPEIMLDITNGGGLTLDDVTVLSLPTWLTADKIISGPANTQQIKFTADPSGLPDGLTEDTVTLEALNATPTTRVVPTSIFVAEAPTLQLSSLAEAFTLVEGGPQPDPPLGGDKTVQAFALGDAQLPAVLATPDQAWLSASVSGVGDDQIITLSLIEVIAFALPLGDHVANVAVTSDGIANSPQTIVVTLSVVGPFVQLDVADVVLTPTADYTSSEPTIVTAKIVGNTPSPVSVTGGAFWLGVEVDTSDLNAQLIKLTVIDRPRTREEFSTTLLVSGSTPATLTVSMAESGLTSRPDCDIDFVERIDPDLLIKCDVPIVPPPILGPPEDTPSDGDGDCEEPEIEYDFGITECLYGTMWWTKGNAELGWCKPKLHLQITHHGCSGESPGAGDYCGSAGEDDLVVTSITLDACGHVCAVECETDDDSGGT
jgi:hypothetical protein